MGNTLIKKKEMSNNTFFFRRGGMKVKIRIFPSHGKYSKEDTGLRKCVE